MKRALALFVACACFAQQPARKKSETPTIRSFLIWLARVSGLSATPNGLRGPESGHHEGEIWIAPIAGGARQPLMSGGGYSWPIFSADDQSVIALRGSDLWSLPLNGGKPVKLPHTSDRITSLVGAGPEGIVILTAEQIGTFAPNTGVFSPFAAASAEDQDEINRLRSSIRAYDDGKLIVSEKRGAIVIQNGGQPREVTSDNAKLWQPSVSHDLKRLVYIRVDDSPQ